MGLTDNSLVKAFINGGAPPASYKQKAWALPPAYSLPANKPKPIQNDELQKTQIYLNLPTQKEREQLQREEQLRREKGDDKPNSKWRRLQRKIEKVTEFGGRAGGFGMAGGG